MARKYKTRQQSAVRECLELHKDGYVTVNEIEKYLKDNNCSVGLTTIYRQLDKLEQDGVVIRINVEGQSGACFQYAEKENAEDCFYLQCEGCGKVTKMECHQLAELYHHLNSDHHFSINPQKTVLFGRCEKCGK